MRTLVLVDGRNLYHLAGTAWASGSASPYAWPSYDVEKLAHILDSNTPGRPLPAFIYTRAYPTHRRAPRSYFGTASGSNKIRYLRSRGVYVYRGGVSRFGIKAQEHCAAAASGRCTAGSRSRISA